VNDLETLVLRTIGENVSSPDVFTDTDSGMAQIRDSLNDAIEEISMLTGSLKASYHLPMEDSKGFYRFELGKDKMAWITDAWLVGQKRRLEQTDIIRLNKFNPHWMRNTGTPQSYFPIGKDAVGIWPRPASETDVIDFTFVIVPDRYDSDTDRIRVRSNYRWAAVYFAVGEYYASRGDAKSALYYHGIYLDKLGVQALYPKSYEQVSRYQTNKEPQPRPTG